jgi:hypothetical protein
MVDFPNRRVREPQDAGALALELGAGLAVYVEGLPVDVVGPAQQAAASLRLRCHC